MQLKLDVQTLVIGITLGIIVTVAIGAGVGSADADRFGVAIENQGNALVRTSNGSLYVVNPKEGMATQVLVFNNLGADPDDSRTTSRSTIFNLEGPNRPSRSKTR